MLPLYRVLSSAIVFSLSFTISARDVATDSLSIIPYADVGEQSPVHERFDCKQLILPASLITVGALGAGVPWFKKLNHDIRDGIVAFRGEHTFPIDNYIQYVPAVAYQGLGIFGVRSRNPLRERVAAELTAIAATAVMTNATKYIVKEKRPNSGRRNSFPSGHTATAFMGAELIRLEYPAGYAIGAYSIAVLTGVLRMYNDWHWLNDVIAGAGVGILAARIGYWMLPVYRKWFHWDNSHRKTTILAFAPTYNPDCRALGLSIAIRY